MVLLPQVSVAVLKQARVYRMDWLVLYRKRWIDVEMDGRNRSDAADTMRTWGLDLLELRYSNPAVLAWDFTRRLKADVIKIVERPPLQN